MVNNNYKLLLGSRSKMQRVFYFLLNSLVSFNGRRMFWKNKFVEFDERIDVNDCVVGCGY